MENLFIEILKAEKFAKECAEHNVLAYLWGGVAGVMLVALIMAYLMS